MEVPNKLKNVKRNTYKLIKVQIAGKKSKEFQMKNGITQKRQFEPFTFHHYDGLKILNN